MRKSLLILPVLAISLSTTYAGRFAAGGFSREGPNGGSVEGQGVRAGRFSAGEVSATGPNGGTYDASGARAGRYSTGSASATGPNGGTYDASRQSYGRYSQGTVNATGPNGGSYSAAGASWNGYRSGYVYRGGAYYPANVVVNKAYIAPVGAYAGWTVITQPYYVTYPVYATYPVEVAVQVQLQRLGYYGGAIDGQIGPSTQAAIAKFQSQNGIAVTGTITQALLKTLHIS